MSGGKGSFIMTSDKGNWERITVDNLPHKWIDLDVSYRTRCDRREPGWGGRPTEGQGDGHMRLPAMLDEVSAFVRFRMA